MNHNVVAATTAGGTDAPHVRAMLYRQRFGLDAQVQPGTDRIFVRAGKALAAFTMPDVLGIQVKVRLRARSGCVGPIIAHPRSKRWTFPALPADTDLSDLLVYAEMFRHYVDIASVNAEILLPSPADRHPAAYRLWVDPPVDDYLPLAGDVLNSVRECLAAQGGRRHHA